MVKSYATVIREAVRRKWQTPEQKEWWYGKLSAIRRRKALVLFRRQDGKCYFCDQLTYYDDESKGDLPKKRLATLDHKIPQKLGGTDSLHNLVMACLGCNNARGVMQFDHFVTIRKDPEKYELHIRRRAGIKRNPSNKGYQKKVAKRHIRIQRTVWNLAVLFWLRPDLKDIAVNQVSRLSAIRQANRQARLERTNYYR